MPSDARAHDEAPERGEEPPPPPASVDRIGRFQWGRTRYRGLADRNLTHAGEFYQQDRNRLSLEFHFETIESVKTCGNGILQAGLARITISALIQITVSKFDLIK
jgi:hypothetical protein